MEADHVSFGYVPEKTVLKNIRRVKPYPFRKRSLNPVQIPFLVIRIRKRRQFIRQNLHRIRHHDTGHMLCSQALCHILEKCAQADDILLRGILCEHTRMLLDQVVVRSKIHIADLLLHLYCRMVVSDRDLHTLSFPQTPVCRTLFCLIQLCFRCSGLFRSMSVKSEHHFFSGL